MLALLRSRATKQRARAESRLTYPAIRLAWLHLPGLMCARQPCERTVDPALVRPATWSDLGYI